MEFKKNSKLLKSIIHRKLKSIIIQSKENKIKLISQLAFSLSPREIAVIEAVHSLRGSDAFILNESFKSFLIAGIGGNNDNIKTTISRLVKRGAIIKSGRMYGLHSAYKDCQTIEQIVIRFK